MGTECLYQHSGKEEIFGVLGLVVIFQDLGALYLLQDIGLKTGHNMITKIHSLPAGRCWNSESKASILWETRNFWCTGFGIYLGDCWDTNCSNSAWSIA